MSWYATNQEVEIARRAPGVHPWHVGLQGHVTERIGPTDVLKEPVYRVHLGSAIVVVPHWALKKVEEGSWAGAKAT